MGNSVLDDRDEFYGLGTNAKLVVALDVTKDLFVFKKTREEQLEDFRMLAYGKKDKAPNRHYFEKQLTFVFFTKNIKDIEER